MGALAGHPLTQMSEQELTSCSVGHGVPQGWLTLSGCGGGFADAAMDWVINSHNGSLTSEKAYPFFSGGGLIPGVHGTGRCNQTLAADANRVAKFSAYETTAYDEDNGGNESQMLAYMSKNGPIAITVCDHGFKHYQHGIMTGCNSACQNHVVTAVGYGHDTNTSTPYWIVKNSWNVSWGEEGYTRFEYGKNLCNIKSRGAASLRV